MNPQNNKDGSGQTETDELDAIIEKLSGACIDAAIYIDQTNDLAGGQQQALKAQADAKTELWRYSHHQTEQVLERLREQRRFYPTEYLELVKLDAIDAELERLKEQSLPTNKDKEK
jgi:hypothetical protein